MIHGGLRHQGNSLSLQGWVFHLFRSQVTLRLKDPAIMSLTSSNVNLGTGERMCRNLAFPKRSSNLIIRGIVPWTKMTSDVWIFNQMPLLGLFFWRHKIGQLGSSSKVAFKTKTNQQTTSQFQSNRIAVCIQDHLLELLWKTCCYIWWSQMFIGFKQHSLLHLATVFRGSNYIIPFRTRTAPTRNSWFFPDEYAKTLASCLV